MDAHQEKVFTIAEANTRVDEHGNFLETRLGSRHNNEPTLAYVSSITHIDVSPKQIVSVSTSLIPFVEHDDATRAEMGSNMMRQGVPLVRPESPIVGTGMERIVGEKSGYSILAEKSGEVIGVDAKHISVLYEDGKKSLYDLMTYQKSNNSLLIHQVPRVSKGDKVVTDQILADGQATQNGEIAVGRNLTVAYMPWEGYNFEDAIILSRRLVEDDQLTNITISEYTLDVRETKL